VNFKQRPQRPERPGRPFNHKGQGGFPMPPNEGHLLVYGSNKKADIKYPFEHGKVINYTLDDVSIQSHNKDTGVLPNSVPGKEGNCLGISP
jgi:hypothetical protein